MNRISLALMKFFVFFSVLGGLSLLLPAYAFAEGEVTGQVLDAGTLIPIEGIEVVIEGREGTLQTDPDGGFVFRNVPAGKYKVIFQSTKYERVTKDIDVDDGKRTIINIDLKVLKGAAELAEVSVSARREVVDTAKQTVTQEEITTAPGAAADAVRVVQSLPGVTNIGIAALGTPGLIIRGTGAEDSRYYLDGFDIPQLFHFGGLLTVVNSEWLDSIDYYAGGYSVRYGNAIGGIVELKTRLPKSDKFSGVVDLTNYSSYILLETPLDGEGKWSAGVSVRRSFIDFILPEFLSEDEGRFTILPRFYDFQVAVAYKPSAVNAFELFAFSSNDAAGLVSDDPSEDMPTAAQSFEYYYWFYRPILSWIHTPSSDINNRLAVSPNIQKFRTDFLGDKFLEITVTGGEIREDFTIKPAAWNTLSLGAMAAYGSAEVGANIIRPPKEGQPTGMEIFNEKSYHYESTLDLYVTESYLEDSIKIGKWMTLTPGLRGAGVFFESDTQSASKYYFDPRFFARFYLTDRATLKGSTGVYHQLPSADELLEPFGTITLTPETSYSHGGGIEYDFGRGYKIDMQGYYKQLTDMVSATTGDSEDAYDNVGIGKIYGAEFLFRKELTDRLYGWVSYTYCVSQRKDHPDSDWRYFDQDQRHNFIILGSYRLGDTWRVGARFAYASGLPYTEIDSAIYNADSDSYIPVYSDKVNEKRQADLNQLDVRVDKAWPFKKWTLKTYLDIQNVYAKKQPIGYIYNYDYTKKEPVSWPTFYPTLGLQARW